MKKIKTLKRVIPALIALMICVIIAVPALSLQINSEPNRIVPLNVLQDLRKLEFWVFLLTTLVAGAIGGIVYELLTLEGKFEMPHLLNAQADGSGSGIISLGIISRVFIGAFAAIASLLFLSPTSTIELIAMGVIVGSIGTSIFRSMQDRIIATLSIKEAKETKRIANEADELVGRAMEKLSSESSVREAESLGVPDSERSSDLAEKQANVRQLLKEARAKYQSIQKT
jgi:hypothetical protein